MRTREELQKAVAEIASTAGEPGKKAYAQLITELLQPNHITFDVFSAFLPVERYKPGDYVTRKVRKGRFRSRTMVMGASHLTDAMVYNNQFTYLFDQLIAGTSMNINEVRNGELGTLDEIKSEVKADLIDECVSKVWNVLTTVWNSTNTPLNYQDASSTGLTSTGLDYSLENLIEKAGNVNAIVGSRRALLPLYSFAGYKDVLLADNTTRKALWLGDVLMERFDTGRVSKYNGIPVIEIPQILENRLPIFNRKLVRDNIVMLMGQNAGRIALFGDPQEQEFTDYSKQPADYTYHTWQQWGILVDRPEYMGIIKVS